MANCRITQGHIRVLAEKRMRIAPMENELTARGLRLSPHLGRSIATLFICATERLRLVIENRGQDPTSPLAC